MGSFWDDWQTPQYVQNGPQCGAPNTYERLLVINIAGGLKFATQISPLLNFIYLNNTQYLQTVKGDLAR